MSNGDHAPGKATRGPGDAQAPLRQDLPQPATSPTEAQLRIATLEAWVRDLQSGLFINCVYCGHRYGPSTDTPVAMADVLKAHVAHCPAHPMSVLKAALERIRDNDTGGCRCEHDDENCCARAADYCCPFCIASVALSQSALKDPPAVDASDPHVGSTGNPTRRDESVF